MARNYRRKDGFLHDLQSDVAKSDIQANGQAYRLRRANYPLTREVCVKNVHLSVF